MGLNKTKSVVRNGPSKNKNQRRRKNQVGRKNPNKKAGSRGGAHSARSSNPIIPKESFRVGTEPLEKSDVTIKFDILSTLPTIEEFNTAWVAGTLLGHYGVNDFYVNKSGFALVDGKPVESPSFVSGIKRVEISAESSLLKLYLAGGSPKQTANRAYEELVGVREMQSNPITGTGRTGVLNLGKGSTMVSQKGVQLTPIEVPGFEDFDLLYAFVTRFMLARQTSINEAALPPIIGSINIEVFLNHKPNPDAVKEQIIIPPNYVLVQSNDASLVLRTPKRDPMHSVCSNPGPTEMAIDPLSLSIGLAYNDGTGIVPRVPLDTVMRVSPPVAILLQNQVGTLAFAKYHVNALNPSTPEPRLYFYLTKGDAELGSAIQAKLTAGTVSIPATTTYSPMLVTTLIGKQEGQATNHLGQAFIPGDEFYKVQVSADRPRNMDSTGLRTADRDDDSIVCVSEIGSVITALHNAMIAPKPTRRRA